MPTKKFRVTANLDPLIGELIQRDAKAGFRSEAAQVEMIVSRYYLERQVEAEIFHGEKLSGDASADIPTFRGDPPTVERLSKRRVQNDRGGTQ